MGQTQDYPTLNDQITICPTDISDDGSIWMLPSTCNSHNAVEMIYCKDFITVCPNGENFYFRL
jgi:hypothetical protein